MATSIEVQKQSVKQLLERGQGTYFLGTVVSYENEQGEQEIIDGQQRITSLFLLLRAIYTKLQAADTKSKEAKNFINQIEPAIWRTNKLTGEVDYSNILLESRVVNNEGNSILRDILKEGKTVDGAKDNYSLCVHLFSIEPGNSTSNYCGYAGHSIDDFLNIK